MKAEMAGEDYFPLVVGFRKPSGAELLKNFGAIRDWLRLLKKESRNNKGYGYDIEFAEVKHRTLGPQLLPHRIIIPSREDFLRLIDKQQYRQFQADLLLVREEQPQLLHFLSQKAGRLLDYGGAWQQLLAVVAYFKKNPKPNCYLRELDISGVDSKFLEQHRKIVGELLDQLLPASAIDESVTGLSHHGMGVATLQHNPDLWGREDDQQRFLDELAHLTRQEESLYNDLRSNTYGINIRLEQERISFSVVRKHVDSCYMTG